MTICGFIGLVRCLHAYLQKIVFESSHIRQFSDVFIVHFHIQAMKKLWCICQDSPSFCHLHLINTTELMITTVRLNEDANSSAPNSGSGCCSCVSALVLVCVSDVERLTALQLWPFTFSITQSSSHRLASFHLLTPAPVPGLVLISSFKCVYACVYGPEFPSACKMRWEKI